MGKVLKIFIAIVLHFSQIPEGYSKRLYELNIDEKGTSFNESIEVDDAQKRVVYHVPSHNGIRKSDTLVDYKNGLFVTKMIEREECYIKAFPIAEEQSIRETKQNLELLEVIKKRSKNTSIPVETVTTAMKVIREIPREELSPKVLEFCGDYTAYEVEEKRKKGKSFVKRAANIYRLSFRTTMAKTVKKILPNGYLTCDPAKNHAQALSDCFTRGKIPLVGCGEFPIKCRYQVTCNVAGKDEYKLAAPHNGRDSYTYQYVDINCVEQHKFTVNYCCDVIPCP